jgi:hypothetical protein
MISAVAWCRLRREAAMALTTVLAAALLVCRLGSVGEAWAQTTNVTHSPAEVVQKYVLLDNKGARLDAASYEAVAPFVRWKEEPVWGKIIVIDGFSVPEDYRQWEILSPLDVVVPVEFQVLGVVYLDTAGFIPDPSVEQLRVHLKVFNNRWRIVEPMYPPHVGQRRMLNFVRQAMQEETGEVRRETLAALQNELRKAK